jgi:hypothetical protein
MHPIETMSRTRHTHARILIVASFRISPEVLVFPNCANGECAASFGKLRDGNLFRFRRVHAAGDSPGNNHSVVHAWLCAKCCETYTLEYRNNQLVLTSLAPPVPVTTVVGVPARKRRRTSRSIRRPSPRRAPLQNAGGAPVVVLAITRDFPDRS